VIVFDPIKIFEISSNWFNEASCIIDDDISFLVILNFNLDNTHIPPPLLSPETHLLYFSVYSLDQMMFIEIIVQ